ncbi:MAG: GDP-mannose 4,6-dehydratase [Rhizobiales bacterium]|nr:GDP-mannose 4,6-dehydratase [Hyphomicrobiales bacterium]
MPKQIFSEQHRTALITGVTGQDGGYLAALLLKKGYLIHGLARDPASLAMDRFAGIPDVATRLILHRADMADGDRLRALVDDIRPDEIYNLAAQSHVQASFDDPAHTAEVNAAGPLHLLQALHELDAGRRIRFCQASSSEMFGEAKGLQDEMAPLHPANPYAAAKCAAFEAVIRFREAHGLHASNAILFNHESPYRHERFVTRKISMAVAGFYFGQGRCLRLGNLDTRRDWGHARDYVAGMWLMLQQATPGDYVFATGQNHSVRDFVERAFAEIGREIVWEGAAVNEVGRDARSGEVLVMVDAEYFRPTDLQSSLGDASKARRLLGWHIDIDFNSLVREMVAADIARLEAEHPDFTRETICD